MNAIKTLAALVLLIDPLLAKNPSRHTHHHHHGLDKIQIQSPERSEGSDSIDRRVGPPKHELWPGGGDGVLPSADAIKTYERVVLEGSRISLSCPHATIIDPNRQPAAAAAASFVSRVQCVAYGSEEGGGADEKQEQKREKRFVASAAEHNRTATATTTTACHELEQVKWFRNHVPLVEDANRFLRAARQRNTKQVAAYTEQILLGPQSLAAGGGGGVDVGGPNAAPDLNWTTELFQTTTAGGPISGTSGSSAAERSEREQWQPRQPHKIQPLPNQFETFDSLRGSSSTSFNPDSSGLLKQQQWASLTNSSSGSENVNELVGRRMRATGARVTAAAPATSSDDDDDDDGEANGEPRQQWFLNAFGELVINRVTQHSAGKYTCLLGGQQSEVLLDVLATGGNFHEESRAHQNKWTQARKVGDGNSHLESGGASAESRVEAATARKIVVSVGDDSSGDPTGNEPIEKKATFDSGVDTTRTNSSSSAAPNSFVQLDSSQQQLATAAAADEGGEDPQKRADDPGADNSSSPDADTIVNLIDTLASQQVQEVEQAHRMAAGGGGGGPAANKAESLAAAAASRLQLGGGGGGNLESDLDLDSDLERQTKRMALNKLAQSAAQPAIRWRVEQRRRPQVHVVKSEAIQMSELRLVPGFLYTKQQLYCPIAGLTELHSDHIYPLVHELCPTSSATAEADARKASARRAEQLIKCRRLAKHLIWQILVSGERRRRTNCLAPILDLVWFKDGKQLEFDTNGRASNTHTNLNVKLIDSPATPTIGASDSRMSQSSDSGQHYARNEGAQLNNNKRQQQHQNHGKGRIGSMASARNKRRSRNNNQLLLVCPPRGRALEIDGISRESAGRYTCALKLSIPKLEKIIQTIRQKRSSSSSTDQLVERLQQPSALRKQQAHVNDISCCDKITAPERATNFETPVGNVERRRRRRGDKSASQQEESYPDPGSDSSSDPYPAAAYMDEHASSSSGNESAADEAQLLAQRTALLQRVLNGTIASDNSLTYIGRLMSRARVSPKTIQTFSLVVAERAANSCDLWSTILEAGYAYTRRKWADFRRLKRNSNGASIRSERKSARLAPLDVSAPTKSRLKNVYSSQRRAMLEPFAATTEAPGDSVASHRPMDANRSDGSRANSDELAHYAAHQIQPSSSATGAGISEFYQGNRRWHNDASRASNFNSADPRSEDHKLAVEEEEEPLYGWRSISGDDGSQIGLAAAANIVGRQQEALLNNSDRFAASDIATAISSAVASGLGQTNIHTVGAAPFNYANERLLHAATVGAGAAAAISAPNAAVSGAHDDVTASVLPQGHGGSRGRRHHRSPMIKGNHEYLGAGTKDLITQRGFQGINGGPLGQITNFQLTPPAESSERRRPAFISQWHPMVMDSVQNQEPPPSGAPPSRPERIIDSRRPDSGGNKINYPTGGGGHEITAARDQHIPFQGLFAADSRKSAGVRRSQSDRVAADQVAGISETREQLRDKLLTGDANNVDPIARYKRDSGNNLAGTAQSTILNEDSNSAEANEIEARHQNVEPANLDASLAKPWPPIYQQALDDDRQSSVDSGGDTSSYGLGLTEPKLGQPTITADPIIKPMVYDDRFDESLMWAAGQYLYMHMKALAASSMFGVEVAVEWSNERSNGTSIDLNEAAERSVESEMAASNQLNGGGGIYGRARDAVPFATIDVIAGQSLQLQCTAQALGRLPEVRWYKRVTSIPSKLKGLVNMARKIGHDLYWPLTELDILNEYETPKRGKSFVCSQTTAIFDNLANQTFTVISSLKLSQYNDIFRAETIKSNHAPIGNSNYNLYACIVDADVRHNYATLGVHFREAPSKKISSEISKRLHARSALKKPQDAQMRTQTITDKEIVVGAQKYTNFDLYRESQLQFPLKSGYWIPIQGNSSASSSYSIENSSDGHQLTPSMVSAAILFVFTSLLALTYLTLRTYRNLTQNQLEEDLIDQQSDGPHDEQVVQRGDMIQVAQMDVDMHTGCPCQFGDQSSQVQRQTPSISQQSEYMIYGGDPYATCLSLNKATEFVTNDSMDQIYYQTHTLEDIRHQCVCHAANASIIAALPSENKSNYSFSNYDSKAFTGHIITDCCQSTLIPIVTRQQSDSRSKVNLIENPLIGREQYVGEKSTMEVTL